MKIKKQDKVLVIAGKDRGKTGKIKSVILKENGLMVEGVNIIKKHLKTQGKKKGGIVEMESPVNASNVLILCPNCNKPTRVALKMTKNGKERMCKKCEGSLDKVIKEKKTK